MVKINHLINILKVFLGIYLINIICAVLVRTVAFYAGYSEKKYTYDVAMVSMLMTSVICILLIYPVYAKTKNNKKTDRFNIFRVIMLIITGVGASVFFSVVMGRLSIIFPDLFKEYVNTMEGMLKNSPLILMLLYTLFSGIISEEIVFRGVVLSEAECIFGFMGANILQALLFGIYHGNLIQGIYAFFFGLIMGMLCKWFDSILAGMLFHFAFNGTSYVITALDAYVKNSQLYTIICIVGVLVFVGGLIYFSKSFKSSDSPKTIKPS